MSKQTDSPPGLKFFFTGTPKGGCVQPDIILVRGHHLKTWNGWAEEVAQTTLREAHLLPQRADHLVALAQEERIIVAFDLTRDHKVVGCIALWHLTESEGQTWGEMGSVFVHPEYRHSTSGLELADQLYLELLNAFPHVNILATTTNRAAIRAGERTGLKHVGFDALPGCVREATCICPASKTGTLDNRSCPLANAACLVRVSGQTHERMGSPTLLPLPSWAR